MIKYLRSISIALLIITAQNLFANSNWLFNVSATGTTNNVNITLCLNGKGPLSCQNYNVSALNLSICANPTHNYPNAGIKINTPGYTIDNSSATCAPLSNGYCLFQVSNTACKHLSLLGGSSDPLPISPSSLASATLGTPYNQTVSAGNGVEPYTYALSAGALPTGLALDASTGVISGTPTAAGTAYFTIKATDAHSNTGSQSYIIVVNGSVSITPSSLPNGSYNATYSQTITASGGTTPYTYASIGTLPAGLTLNSSTGVLSGTPTVYTATSYSFTITATDADNKSASQAYNVTISNACNTGNTTATLSATTVSPISFTGTGFMTQLGYSAGDTEVTVCEASSCDPSEIWYVIPGITVTSVTDTLISSGNNYGSGCKSICNTDATLCTLGIASS